MEKKGKSTPAALPRGPRPAAFHPQSIQRMPSPLAAPSVYRPQAAPSSAPPVYRPQQQPVRSIQPKVSASSQAHKAAGPPPVYRSQPLKMAQPKAAVPPARLQPPRAAIQPFIAKGTTVYYPDTVTFNPGTQSKANFERALGILGGPPGTDRNTSQRSWNSFAQGIGGYEVNAMGSPFGGTNQKGVKRMFLDETTVYYFKSTENIQTATPAKYPLLSMHDMAEKNGPALPASHTHVDLRASKCVIEILEDFGLNVPGPDSSSVTDWHKYSRDEGLDYRQDNNYIVLYVQKLGCRLISTKITLWKDWNPDEGRYLVATGSGDGAVGHMIGVTVDGDKNKTITDKQQLSPGTGRNPANFDNFKVSYVFKVP